MSSSRSVGSRRQRPLAQGLFRQLVMVVVFGAMFISSARGQAFELGASLGTGATGTESELVGDWWYRVPGVYGNVSWLDRLETSARVAWVRRGPLQGRSGYFNGCEGGVSTPGCRPPVAFYIVEEFTAPWTFVTGSAVYSFRRGQVVRPFAGLGVGVSRQSTRVSCEPAASSCAPVAGTGFLGRRVNQVRDVVAIGGLAATVKRHYVLRGAMHFHRPGGEDSSLFELALSLGYRF